MVLSKFILSGIAVSYVVLSVVALFFLSKDSEKWFGFGLFFLSMCFNGVGFFTAYEKTASLDILIFYGFMQFVLLLFGILYVVLYNRCNRVLIAHVCFLLSVGMLLILRLKSEKSVKQLMICSAALLFCLVIPHVMKHLPKMTTFNKWYGSIGVLVLLAVFILGSVTNGAKLSYTIFGISFQPSEVVKVLFLLFLASVFSVRKDMKALLYTGIVAAAHVFILFLSKDLGGALVFFLAFWFMALFATRKVFLLPAGIAVISVCSYVGYRTFSHIRVRLQAFLDPWSVIDDKGYQITQSIFAMSRGGLFGTGLFAGGSTKIPYVENDFIFAAITEELGQITGVCVYLICFLTALCILINSIQASRGFCRILLYGIAMMYFTQVFLNIGGNTKFIPLTGLTLPFVSCGGTSILSALLLIGLAQGCMISGKKLYSDEKSDFEKSDLKIKKELRSVYAKERRINKRYIVVTALICGSIVLGNCIYSLWFLQTNKRELINNGYNTETKLLSRSVTRGTIFADDDTVLAESIQKSPTEEIRVYPFGGEYAHVIGYATKGLLGIEKTSNYDLMHASISLDEQIEHAKNREKNPGNNVYTTLNKDIQKLVYSAFEGQKGCVIVSEVKTGKVLALVSAPNFDPALIDEKWEALIADEENSELIDRCIYGLYAVYDPFETAYEIGKHEKELNSDLYAFELGIAQCKMGPEGDYLITPMHLHMLACASVNNGETAIPYVIKRVENANGRVLTEILSGKRVVLTTTEEATSIRAALNVQDDVLTSTSWYTGFSNENDPSRGIAVTVLVEDCSGHREIGEKICKKILKGITR